ncbi:MAG: hypothetical protein CFH34_00380 [Alphaproteobacteria bacterium MarineAlpha9_Bin4]|nr:hypothetical protein [Pelagibacterales bacterium]PPR27260.1 MAG: hypothetical protein CFH34_00380 [Alphaproteobacteria bacterium MarineAlpha9_Bin4]|tara:strand:+ start:420 stop:974 length:555 start_codon:yes stop_codon:yes gene_type:complete
MNKINLNRRSFLKNSGKATGFVALTGGAVQLNAFNAWAAKKSSLDSNVAKTMLLVSKDLFPGNKFSDKLYMISVDSLDGKAATDESLKKSFVDGVAEIDKAAGGKYTKASYKKRVTILKKIQGKPFFNTLRWEMVSVFYNNKKVWDVAGYQGPAYDQGGYYLRGFQDADWPQPSKDASPKGWWE